MNNRDPDISSFYDLLNFNIKFLTLSWNKLDGRDLTKELVTLLINLFNSKAHKVRVPKGASLLNI